MEWVVAILALGCLVFILHMLSDYFKRRQELEPKIRRLEEAREKLQAEIQNSKGALDEQRGQLSPLREELTQLEREALELQQQTPAKKPRAQSGPGKEAK
jgi:chromosome segregation ATPase